MPAPRDSAGSRHAQTVSNSFPAAWLSAISEASVILTKQQGGYGPATFAILIDLKPLYDEKNLRGSWS